MQRQGAAARAAVLLRVVLAAGHAAHPAACRQIPLERFHEKFAVQLNDTHPAIAVAELMRLLVDENAMPMGARLGHHAPDVRRTPTTRCCPRRSSAGRSRMFGRLLPRHLEIIYEINARFLDEVRHRILRATSRIARAVADRRERRALRAHGASRVRRQPRDQRRGGAALRAAEERRADGLRRAVAARSSRNKTNGVTPRRWMVLANPRLTSLHQRDASARRGSATSTSCARLEPLRRRPELSRSAGAGSSAPTRKSSRRS